jgi:hypothetical protein
MPAAGAASRRHRTPRLPHTLGFQRGYLVVSRRRAPEPVKE